MSWLQIAIGALALARELVKYLREREADQKLAVQKVRRFQQAIRKVRKDGQSDDIERSFGELGFRMPNKSDSGKKLES